MQDISARIYDYYVTHFAELPADKQFHFATRLYLWRQDDFARQAIVRLRSEFAGNGTPRIPLQKILYDSRESPVYGSNNAAELRRPYFEKYPTLKTSVLLLFRVTFLKHIYAVDGRQALADIIPGSDFTSLADKLLRDEAALATLSTHAVNFLYLYSRVVAEDEHMFDPGLFLEVGRSAYDPADPIHIQLLIYLYTHCVIGESKFYFRSPAPRYADIYNAMLDDLEALMSQNFTAINLDNKFEYLVCCKLLDRKSASADRIFDEAAASLSDDGYFIIDKHNNNPQVTNVSLARSEHRNVLCIMAASDFLPIAS